MSVTPRVSIGLPVYNGERYLPLAVDSLLRQTFTDFELIISDNASTDATEQICRDYAARDGRVRYVRQSSNVGMVRNFNLLVALARAPLFKWASADDLVAPDLLERCVPIIQSDPSVVLVHSRTQYIGEDGEHLTRQDSSLHLMEERPTDRVFHLWSTLTYCNAPFGVMRTEALRRTPLFGTFVGSDVCFVAELSLHGRFFEIQDRLLFRRFHPEAASGLTPEELLKHYGFKRRKLVLIHWRHFTENVKSIWRAPISPSEKRRALSMVGKRAVWKRAALWRELGFLVRHLTGRSYPVLGTMERFSRSRSGSTQ